MIYEITFGFWESALLCLVSAQATLIAYLHQPRWKVLVYTLPIPFMFASLLCSQTAQSKLAQNPDGKYTLRVTFNVFIWIGRMP